MEIRSAPVLPRPPQQAGGSDRQHDGCRVGGTPGPCREGQHRCPILLRARPRGTRTQGPHSAPNGYRQRCVMRLPRGGSWPCSWHRPGSNGSGVILARGLQVRHGRGQARTAGIRDSGRVTPPRAPCTTNSGRRGRAVRAAPPRRGPVRESAPSPARRRRAAPATGHRHTGCGCRADPHTGSPRGDGATAPQSGYRSNSGRSCAVRIQPSRSATWMCIFGARASGSSSVPVCTSTMPGSIASFT
jgi:hypothetical protein